MDITEIINKKEDFVYWRARHLLNGGTKSNPSAKYQAIKELSKLISNYNEGLQTLYVNELSTIHKLKAKQFTDELKTIELETVEAEDLDEIIPEGVDPQQYEKFGFYELKNEYHFRSNGNKAQKLSNFIMNPLFHVISINDTRRIYELINYRGFRVVIDCDMQEMVSLQAFKRNVEGRGNFLFWGTETHFNKLKLKLYEETKTCQEVANLGWQKEGFWAWANGIITQDGFKPVDENGLVMYNDKYYYISAFSKIYIDDKTLFIGERKFRYIDRDIPMRLWAEKFIQVFGDNAKIAISFWLASLFRDHILWIFSNFPLLNLFGPKGSGKSQLAMSLSCLFGIQQTPFNIHNGTKPGLAEHVQQFVNGLAWVDEYKNNIEVDKIETLKSIYDAIGRNRLNFDKGKKKETTLVNSAVPLSGQEMPTADVALFSRVVLLQFHKTEFSGEEKRYYDELKGMERDGLSHLTSQVIKHRELFEKNFYSHYEQVMADMFKTLEHANIEDRILRSYCTIVAAFKTLEKEFDLPFTYRELADIAIRYIQEQNNQIGRSNEIANFWQILEGLFDEEKILDRWNFKVDTCQSLNLKTGKKELEAPVEVLKIQFNSIYMLYSENARKTGQSLLPSSTLKYYLENNKAFLGVEKTTKFKLKLKNGEDQQKVTTSYCFNYADIEKMFDINLRRHKETQLPDSETNPETDKNADDIPF